MSLGLAASEVLKAGLSYHLLEHLTGTGQARSIEEAKFAVSEHVLQLPLACDLDRLNDLADFGFDQGVVIWNAFECTEHFSRFLSPPFL